jgi:hypothetical protein
MTSIVEGVLKSLSSTLSEGERQKTNRNAKGQTPELFRALDGSVLDDIEKSGFVELPVVFCRVRGWR